MSVWMKHNENQPPCTCSSGTSSCMRKRVETFCFFHPWITWLILYLAFYISHTCVRTCTDLVVFAIPYCSTYSLHSFCFALLSGVDRVPVSQYLFGVGFTKSWHVWSVFVQEQGLMLCFLVEGEAKLSLLKVRIEGCCWGIYELDVCFLQIGLHIEKSWLIFPWNYCLIFTTLAQWANNLPAHM